MQWQIMILSTKKTTVYNAKTRKIVCIEVSPANNVVRIDDSDIKEIVSSHTED